MTDGERGLHRRDGVRGAELEDHAALLVRVRGEDHRVVLRRYLEKRGERASDHLVTRNYQKHAEAQQM